MLRIYVAFFTSNQATGRRLRRQPKFLTSHQQTRWFELAHISEILKRTKLKIKKNIKQESNKLHLDQSRRGLGGHQGNKI